MCLYLLFVRWLVLIFLLCLGRSLPHSLSFDWFQISDSGPFSSFSIDGCLPDAGGGATRASM